MNVDASKPEGFCMDCGVHVASFEGLTCCPNCGSESTPCSMAGQVDISINWQELRVLCIWAENWGHERAGGAGTIYSIAQRILAQHPDMPPITLAGEVQDLKDEMEGEGYDVNTNVPGVE